VGADVSRPIGVAAAAVALFMLLRFAASLVLWSQSGIAVYTRHWTNLLTLTAALVQGLSACVLFIGSVAWLAGRQWAKPMMLIGLGGWLASLCALLFHFLVMLSEMSHGGTAAPIFVANSVAERLVQFVLPLLLAWLVIRVPVRRPT
jgi:hypothetical protein